MINAERVEKDSIGELKVPEEAYWGAQTQRALNYFRVSGIVFPMAFINSLVMIKKACAAVNLELGLLKPAIAGAIERGCDEIIAGKFEGQFPLDIFQTGSGTSTNMNVNEVIATRANEILSGRRQSSSPGHPNDHVNMGQSSNDVIPAAIHVSAYLQIKELLLPSLEILRTTIEDRSPSWLLSWTRWRICRILASMLPTRKPLFAQSFITACSQ